MQPRKITAAQYADHKPDPLVERSWIQPGQRVCVSGYGGSILIHEHTTVERLTEDARDPRERSTVSAHGEVTSQRALHAVRGHDGAPPLPAA